MKKLLITGAIISGLIMVSPTAALAYPQGKSKCLKCAQKASKCKISKLKSKTKLLWENQEDLGLKDDQLEKIADIKHATIKELIQLKADKDIVKVDLKSLMYADTIDVDEANKLIDAKYQAKKDSAKVYIKAVSDIQQVLSKDQRSQWKELCKKAKDKPSCAKCAAASGKFCPLTGKKLDK